MDCEQEAHNRSMKVSIPDITPSGFTAHLESFNGCNAYGIECAWMTLPNDLHLEYGSVDTNGAGAGVKDNISQRIVFNQGFSSPPKICVWFQEIDFPSMKMALPANVHDNPFLRDSLPGMIASASNNYTAIRVTADDITDTSFTLSLASWLDRKYTNIRAGWFAYPAEQDGKRVRSGREKVTRAQPTSNKQVPFSQPFSRTPATFSAISEIDFGSAKHLRMKCKATAPNERELKLDYGTWDDSEMDHAHITWIAIE